MFRSQLEYHKERIGAKDASLLTLNREMVP